MGKSTLLALVAVLEQYNLDLAQRWYSSKEELRHWDNRSELWVLEAVWERYNLDLVRHSYSSMVVLHRSDSQQGLLDQE